MQIAVLGGTGPQGRGLARRFAAAGLEVVIGSRHRVRADEVAALISSQTGRTVRGFDKQGPSSLRVAEGSAAQQAQSLLPDSTVVAAFHHVSAALLEDPAVDDVDTDVIVVGDVRAATDLVQSLAETIPGVRGVYGGRLRNAGQIEALTANLISINRRYRAHAGVRVTDI